jgi:RecB family exonuclease
VRCVVERYEHAEELGPDAEPLVRGKVAHETLERTLRELGERTGSSKVRPQTLESARELLHAALEEIAARTPISASPERLAAGVRRLQADLGRYLEAAAHDGSAFEPRHLEASFGFEDTEPDSLAPLELEAPDGPLRLRGRIDRIDVEPGTDRAQVIDYKTGRATESARWERDRSFQAALYLRAATDLLGLEPAGAFYQPLSAADMRRRGVIADDADPDLDAVATDRRPAAEMDALLGEVIGLATEAAAQARAGALEPRPDTCTGRGCAYPGLCRCEAA